MLKDVLKLSKSLYNVFLLQGKTPAKVRSLYDSYRNLDAMINKIHLVADHYLVLRLDESFLQNSSYGEPKEKWRRVLNDDLETLNQSVKKHLLCLQTLTAIDPNNPEEPIYPLEQKFNDKAYYGFVRDHYDVGHVNAEGTHLVSMVLTNTYDPKNYQVLKADHIEIDTYEKKVALQNLLKEKAKRFAELKNDIAEYLKSHYIIEDLL